RPALPVCEPQGCDHHLTDRRDRRRVADRRGSRHRRAAARRFLLRPDGAALERAGRLRRAVLGAYLDHLADRARREPRHGSALMDPRKFRLGLLFAVAAITLAFVAPLAHGAPALLLR